MDLGNEAPGVSIPKGLADQFDIELGDEVPIQHDLEDGTLTIHLD